METTQLNKVVVTINNHSFWSEQDFIRVIDDRYSLIYRVNVCTATGEAEHLVVCSLPHSIGQAERGAINRKLRETNAGATISFYIADHEGWAQVITAPDEEFNLFNLAAAISVIKKSCGWDESLPVAVKINDTEVHVWPRFDGQHWIAEDREGANCESLS
ncbi:MAG TPA: hypothetical protein VI260_26840 [Blastocatellia bacterium]|jgi:hypothetical protein